MTEIDSVKVTLRSHSQMLPYVRIFLAFSFCGRNRTRTTMLSVLWDRWRIAMITRSTLSLPTAKFDGLRDFMWFRQSQLPFWNPFVKAAISVKKMNISLRIASMKDLRLFYKSFNKSCYPVVFRALLWVPVLGFVTIYTWRSSWGRSKWRVGGLIGMLTIERIN